MWYLVIVPSYYMHVCSDRPQVFVRLAIADVAGTEYLLNLSRYKQFLEFGG